MNKLIRILALSVFLVGWGFPEASPEWHYHIAPEFETPNQAVKVHYDIVKTPEKLTEQLIHTVVQIQIYHEDQDENFKLAVDYIKRMEQLLSTNIEGSDVDRINKAAGKEPVKVSPETFEIITKALQVAEESNGAFDITIGPLAQLWGIGTDQARKPSDDEIQAAMKKIDYKKVQLDPKEQTVYLEEEGMALELGGISKGYIGSGVANLLLNQGVTTAIINLGGNVVVLGTSPANPDGWNVGVQDPDLIRGSIVGKQQVINGAIVTSGIYERYFEKDGHKYHHILDPKTGYPLDNEISGVTIFAATSFEADAYSTALFLMGTKDAVAFVNQKKDFEAVFIDKDGGVHVTDGLKKTFEITNEHYHLVD